MTLKVMDSKWREGYADGGSSRLEVLNLELIKVRGGYFFLAYRGLGALGFEIINGLEGLNTNYGFIAPTLGYKVEEVYRRRNLGFGVNFEGEGWDTFVGGES